MSASSTDRHTPHREFQRERSKQLFGNRDRMDVVAAVARTESGTVSAVELSRLLDLPSNRVHKQLKALAFSQLLDEVRDGSGRVWYVRCESSVWDACLELSSAWEREYLRSRSSQAS